MKNFFFGVFTMYMITAMLFALCISFTGPRAMNALGAMYYGILWPAWPISTMVGEMVVPIPEWVFTFD